MIFVPYAGGAPAVNALLGQQVTSALVNYSEAAEQIKAGKLRALATASGNRIKPLPDLPTVAESGYAGYESEKSGSVCSRQRRRPRTIFCNWRVGLSQR